MAKSPLEALPFHSCARCYWKNDMKTCYNLIECAASCPDFRPAKITRVKR